MRAVELTGDVITRYAAERKRQGAANGTINRELTALKTMLRLGQRAGKVAQLPHIPKLEEAQPREGFVGPEDLAALLAELEAHHRGWVEALYLTGWRKHEILSRQWRHIDGDWLHLEGDQSKNKTARKFPLIAPLREILDRQRAYVSAIEKRRHRVIPWIFPYPDGRPICFPEQAFKAAVSDAKLAGLVIHDLRRSAVRAMSRAGIPETTIMKLCGMKTRSIFTRYNIADEAVLLEGAAKLEAAYTDSAAHQERIPSKGIRDIAFTFTPA